MGLRDDADRAYAAQRRRQQQERKQAARADARRAAAEDEGERDRRRRLGAAARAAVDEWAERLSVEAGRGLPVTGFRVRSYTPAHTYGAMRDDPMHAGGTVPGNLLVTFRCDGVRLQAHYLETGRLIVNRRRWDQSLAVDDPHAVAYQATPLPGITTLAELGEALRGRPAQVVWTVGLIMVLCTLAAVAVVASS